MRRLSIYRTDRGGLYDVTIHDGERVIYRKVYLTRLTSWLEYKIALRKLIKLHKIEL